MTKADYLEELHNILIHNHVKDTETILTAYEEQFQIGMESGLSEDDMITLLDSPQEVYEFYIKPRVKSIFYRKAPWRCFTVNEKLAHKLALTI